MLEGNEYCWSCFMHHIPHLYNCVAASSFELARSHASRVTIHHLAQI